MSTVNAAQAKVKTVGDPCAAYESIKEIWDRCRVVCNGERAVKDHDAYIDTAGFTNLLIPFSHSMSQTQFNFYKAEAELPGICAQYARMLVGGLLRKRPQLTLPEGVPEAAHEWIINQFGEDGSSLMNFLDGALWEEIQTSRSWIYVDYPVVPEDIDPEEADNFKPFPVLWDSDFVINWRMSKSQHGRDELTRVITSGLTEEYNPEDFHPSLVPTIWVHELENGFYQIRTYKCKAPATSVEVTSGRTQEQADGKTMFELVDTNQNILINGERLTFIPAWPLNGSVEPITPIISPIVDKEVSLYNKVSRRNHLLYGAATYTPIICTNMSDEDFSEITNAGLGSWIRLGVDDKADILKTPTEALADMDRAIAASIEEMAKLGIRMLSPETDQSGVALQLRNASQTAQLGTLNSKVSSTMAAVIAFMINWRYDTDLTVNDVSFSLSTDFNPTPLGADWLRLATEWYQSGLIPRSIWLNILKHNDMLEPDYDDKKGQQEITDDQEMLMKNQAGAGMDFANTVKSMQMQNQQQPPAKKPGE